MKYILKSYDISLGKKEAKVKLSFDNKQNVKLYNITLNVCAEAQREDLIHSLIAQMKQEGLHPDEVGGDYEQMTVFLNILTYIFYIFSNIIFLKPNTFFTN